MAVDNWSHQLQAVCYTFLVTAVISTLLRCYVRVRVIKDFGVDDWCMVAALISFILFITCALIGEQHGIGRHLVDLEPEDIEQAVKYWWLCSLWFSTTMIAAKTSIGCFLLRITVRKLDVWILYGVIITTVCTGTVFFFAKLFQCKPISFFWNKNQSGTCLNGDFVIIFTYVYGGFSLITDLMCTILPMVVVWKLNMKRKAKIALIPILAMGCVASAALIVRFSFIKEYKNSDFLWATYGIAIWCTTEQGLAVTAGSLATLRPLLLLFGQKLGISTSGPSVLQDTDQPIASGGRMGNLKGANGSGNKPHSLFSLTTFTRQDDPDSHGGDSEAAYARQDHSDRPSSMDEGVSRLSVPKRIAKVTTFTVNEDRI
ncbi:hypothetical protein B0J13DRAFT_590616 [Dactylonectria estremocensis]|uniref:Rhodopsin domain-containing protein n=1 Tax=Dactylonectria estremocensis TaxID=1079267 RepID=A0A9P9D7G3_9HYPO|nr:hypothetical protein B0J13DRAFT_590616 [Dactylonectria estremocensis]